MFLANKFTVLAGFCLAICSAWDYTDFQQWCEEENPLCCQDEPGTSQSPIAIYSADVTEDSDLCSPPLSFSSGYLLKHNGTYKNNEHTAQWDLDTSDVNAPRISGGPLLEDTYVFAQMHWHWGSTDSVGSEHTLDDKEYAAELHLVHYNSKYGSLGDAAAEDDGLAVIGLFFDASAAKTSNNQARFSNKARGIITGGKSRTLEAKLSDFLEEDSNLAEYYTYQGSLTTPPCYQSVTWIVMKNPIKMRSSNDLKFFRLMRDSKTPSKKLNNNYRRTDGGALMPTNDREVRTPSSMCT